jgi:hypothetical protein
MAIRDDEIPAHLTRCYDCYYKLAPRNPFFLPARCEQCAELLAIEKAKVQPESPK